MKRKFSIMNLWNTIILVILGTKTLVYCCNISQRRYGAPVGQLIKHSHNVSGDVFAPNINQIYIKGFYYDGEGPDAFFWIGTDGSFPGENGVIIRNPQSSTANDDPSPLCKYVGEDVILDLPKGTNITQVKWISIWCRKYSQNFALVTVSRDLHVPQIRVLPEFSRLAHELSSGNITILNDKTILIPNLHYDGLGPDTYFWVGTGPEPNEYNFEGFKIPNEKGYLEVLYAYNGEDVTLHLPINLNVYDINYLGIWCVKFSHNFGYVSIPEDLWVPPSLVLKTVVNCRDRKNGALVGGLIKHSHNVSGTVFSPNVNQIYIKGFYYDGEGPDAFFWIGTDGSFPDENGVIIRNPQSSTANDDPLPLCKYVGEDVILDLPKGTNITQVKWISIWCRKYSKNFAHVTVSRDLHVPQIGVLAEFSQLAHELSSGNITILNDKTILILNLHYDGLGPDAYFWVGTGPEPDERNFEGFKIPNENGYLDVLKAYNGEDVTLHLPINLTVYDINYLGLWCVKFTHNFGYVSIHEDLWVPPSLDDFSRNTHCLKDQTSSTAALSVGLIVVFLIIIALAIFFIVKRKRGVVADLQKIEEKN